MSQKISKWIIPVLVTIPILVMAKGVMAGYVEQVLDLGGGGGEVGLEVGVIDDGHDREIYYDDGSGQVQITDNEWDDLLPVYSNGLIAWQGQVDNYVWQIFVYEVVTGVTTQLTYGYYPSEYAHAAAGGVVWEMPKGTGSDVFYYDGLDVIRLTNDEFIDELPKTDGKFVVWQHYDGEDVEVFAYIVGTGEVVQLTDDTANQRAVQVYGGEVFYQEYDGNDNEIFGIMIATGVRRQITDNEVDDSGLEVRGRRLVWRIPAENKPVGLSVSQDVLVNNGFFEQSIELAPPEGESSADGGESPAPTATTSVSATPVPLESTEEGTPSAILEPSAEATGSGE